MIKKCLIVLSGLTLILLTNLWGQLYNFKRYSIEENLPRSGVYSLWEDSQGFLWIGTEGGGVSVFDGEKFTTYTTEDGLASNIIRVVFEDERGHLWFGTQGNGVSEFDGKNFITHDTSSGLSFDDIRSISQDNRGYLWLGTFGGGLNRLDLNKSRDDKDFISVFSQEDGLAHNRVRAILKDSQGTMWFGTDGGISSYNGRSFTNFTTEHGLPHNRILSIFEDGSKNLWFGTLDGIVRYDRQNFKLYTTEDGLIHNRVRAIAQDHYGNFWFGTRDGVSKFNGTSFIHFTEQQGLSNNRIRSIILDSLGDLWFGTYFGGINKYTGDEFVHYTETDGLLSHQVLSIASDLNGNIWLGTFEGVSHLIFQENKLQRIINITEKDGLINGVVHSILRDDKERFWFGTENGISIYDGDQFRSLTEEDGLSGSEIFALLQESKEIFWIGTNNGLDRLTLNNNQFSNPSIYNFSENLDTAGRSVSALYRDNKGHLWIGFRDGGLSIYTGDAVINPQENNSQINRVSAIIGESEGNIWIATDGYGIFKYAGDDLASPSFQQYSTQNGLKSNFIYFLVLDDEGNLWAGTEKGVNKISPDFTDVKHFGLDEGFIGIETNPNAVCKDPKGKIWFGTIKGVTCYNVLAGRINKIPPYVHITGVHVASNGKEVDMSPYLKGFTSRFFLPQELELPHNKNNISFEFIGISLKIPSRVSYSWKLEGFDNDWLPPDEKHEVTYTNLSPGDYTFLVKASNDDGIWNQESAKFSFKIRPPFWKSWWFFAACGFIALALFVMYVKIREQVLVKEKQILEEKVKERTVEINRQKEEIEAEKTKSENLLLNILPKDAAEELKLRGKTSPKHFDSVTILFTDFVGFTQITEKLSHEELVEELDRYFIRFDEIIESYNLEKIKTIGDSYMCAGGIRVQDKQGPVRTVLAGLEMQRFIRDANVGKKFKSQIFWHLRVGINTGSIIAGVVGKKKFTYDIWGDTVNIASRMETSGEAGKVNISGTTYAQVKEFFICTHRGKIPAKNKGHIDMYFVEKIKPEFSINQEGIFANDAFFNAIQKK